MSQGFGFGRRQAQSLQGVVVGAEREIGFVPPPAVATGMGQAVESLCQGLVVSLLGRTEFVHIGAERPGHGRIESLEQGHQFVANEIALEGRVGV